MLSPSSVLGKTRGRPWFILHMYILAFISYESFNEIAQSRRSYTARRQSLILSQLPEDVSESSGMISPISML
jgi:hypothetical protein